MTAGARTHGREGRVAYLDRLKLLLVAIIIAGHGALAYGDLESAWPYQDIQEVQLGEVSNALLAMVVIPAVLFTMGLFFLIAGLSTPGSLARKGPRTFARDRLIRLGVPLLVWTLLLWPGAIWLSHLAAGDHETFWAELTDDEPVLDTGPMWFVLVLLIYSLVYAGWRAWGPGRAPDPLHPVPLTAGALVRIAAGISLATALVRLVFPIASPQVGQSHLWQQPQFVAMFALGVVAARRAWFAPIPDGIRRGCGLAALGGIAGWGLIALAVAVTGSDFDVTFDPGLHWPSLAMALIEGPLALGASVWLLGTAQRRLDRPLTPFGRDMARSAYGAFLVQGIVLLALMSALRPLDVPAEVKALAVAGLGVAGSFALAWLLVSRTPAARVV